MSELKSVNIASWGFAIIALLLIMIGLEEMCLFIPDGNWYDWYIPGGELAFIAMLFSLILMVYAFWNGDKKYGIIFGWLAFLFFGTSIVAIKYSYPLFDLLFAHLGILLGHPALAVGVVLAAFTVIFAVWAFYTKSVGRNYGIFLVLMAVFVLLEALGSYFINTENIETTWIFYILPFDQIIMPSSTLMVKGIAGAVAIVAGALGMYIGLGKGIFNGKKEPEDQPLTTFNARGLCGMLLAFVLVMYGLELVLERIDYANGFGWNWENYSDLPALFVFVGIVLSLIMLFFAYWNGDKKNSLFVFATLMFFTIVSFFYANSSYSIAGVIFGEDLNAFFVPAILMAFFMVCMGIWYTMKSKNTRLYGITVFLIAISLVFIGAIQLVENDFDWVYRLEMIAGLFTIAAGLVTLYIGFANCGFGKLKMV